MSDIKKCMHGKSIRQKQHTNNKDKKSDSMIGLILVSFLNFVQQVRGENKRTMEM